MRKAMLGRAGEMRIMSILMSAYEKCRSRLQKDDFGFTLWGYLCLALFAIAAIVSFFQR